MPRRARLRIAGAPLHIIQRGNNRSACFFADHDYGCYLRSTIVQAEVYLLRCQRYIELNPVRAGMVDTPGAYRWSSFSANALGHRSALVTPHSLFLVLGTHESSRRAAYLELFRSELEPRELEEIRTSANAGYALGNEHVRKEIEIALGRRAGPGRPGRPLRESEREGGLEALF
jgi:putative transposase